MNSPKESNIKLRTLKLLLLLAKGEMSTLKELAEYLGTSPQSILRDLKKLQKLGFLSREGSVRITMRGLRFLSELHNEIGRVIYGGFIVGEVVSGIGEGAYYVKIYAERFMEYLGFDPYPGTLNVRLIFPKTVFDAVCDVKPVLIPGFVRNDRTFGDVKAYPVSVAGVRGAIVVPARTLHPPRIAEVIAPVCLREKLGLRDGDIVEISVWRGNGGV